MAKNDCMMHFKKIKHFPHIRKFFDVQTTRISLKQEFLLMQDCSLFFMHYQNLMSQAICNMYM